MNKIDSIIILLLFFLTLPLGVEAKEQYGRKITLTEVTKVSEIMKNPDRYVGKKVMVSGLVVEVCAKRGCWLDIASDEPFEKMQIKVTDGEIVFPMSARGKKALVEGVVEKISLNPKQALSWAKHKAEEKGEVFDPSTVTGPMTIYRVRGLGAVIE
jgi:hypothetical protein